MNDLMQKLAISKKIMDKHNEVPRGQSQLPMVNENVNVNYNIPEGMLNTTSQQPRIQETITTKPINQNAVMNSKLPDEIKRLMIENPIVKPELNGPTLSNEIIEGAARLMGNQNKKDKDTVMYENYKSDNNSDLKQMIRDVVRDTVRDVVKEELHNAGLLTESNQKVNEVLSLRVGKHIFEGKVLNIKKIK